MSKENNEPLEWRINVPNGTSKQLTPDAMSQVLACKKRVREFIARFGSNTSGFLQRARNIAAHEPKKLMHCVKVGLALSLVSLFYYMRPLYDGVGGNAMWAVMTVVVVFEYTVGATLSKCVNRAMGTFTAGALGIGIHWIASRSGEKFEPVILQWSVFIFAVAATFSRFIPSIKARFDYGAMIFILTFSLVSVSGYRVEKIFELAHHRLSTVAIGASICIVTTMLVCPVWAGTELHDLIKTNMEKLSDSLDGCVQDYFGVDSKKDKRLGYKCVLNSKATEESLAIFARWEPTHGNFSFGHPWKEYLKIGACLRSCAYCVETLHATTLNSDIKVPDFAKNRLSKSCLRLTAKSASVARELAAAVRSMTMSSKTDLMIEEMNEAVEDLRKDLNSTPKENFEGIVRLVTVSSLLIEISARTGRIAEAVKSLAEKADFGIPNDERTTEKNEDEKATNQIDGDNGGK